MDIVTLALAEKKSKTYTDSKVAGIGTGMTYKGTVATVADLPASGNVKGDEYNIATGGLYVWNGTAWSPIIA